MKRTFLFILFFLSATYSIELEFQLGPPSFKIVHTDSLTNIELENGVIFSRPGEFELPVLVYHFIAPQNTRVSKLIYEELGDTIISNINLPVLPLLSPDFQEYKTKITQTPSDSFPKERVKLVADGAISGSHIISVMVSPFVYYPQKNELRVIKGYHIKCELEPYSFELVKPYRLTPIGKIHFENLINSLVYNKADIKLYGYNAEPNLSTNISRMTIPPDINDGSLDFVIITPDSFAPILDTLEMLELRLGLSGKVVLVSEIDSYYHGADIIEKIRKFLVDAHRQWGIWAVIIAGDFNNIPLRACSGVDQLGQITSVPALFYYLQLDGSFNSDCDALFGEDASDDLFPELIGGILPFENRTEFIGYINKMRNYIYSIGREYCSRWVFAGASLTRESGEYTGQAAKEMILRRYTIPDGINVIRLYSYASSTGGDYELNRETFLNQIENGTIFINHIDHSSRLTLGTGYKVTGELLTISDIDSLSNEPNFPLLFTFSCHSTDPVLDNISRHWVMNRGGGGIGFIGTSGAVWTTQIFSDQYFIESLIQPYSLIGEIYTNFLMRIIPDRYLIYTYLLNGNPLVDFYFPGGPESLYVERPDSIPNNISTFNIRFYGRDGSAADGVRVVAVDAYGWRSSGITDESGVATLSIRSPELGFVKIYAASSRSLPFEDSIRIYATTSPRPFITHWKIHDDTTGIPRSGFEAFIDLTVKNYGLGRGNISIIGNALSFGLIMLDSTENISSPLSTGESLFVPNALSFVNDTFSGERQFSIELTLESNGNIYKDTITFTAYGPIIKVVSVRYIDTLYGNGDFMPDPGERGEISLLVVNEGKGTLQNGRMELAPYDSDITILSDSFFVSELAESDTILTMFELVMGRTILYGGIMFKLSVRMGRELIQSFNVMLGKPSPPRELSWQGFENSIELSWSPPYSGSSFIQGYRVYRADTVTGPFNLITPTLITLATIYRNTHLPQRTTYYYYVTSVDSSMNESTPSDTIKSWTTFAFHPGFPVKLPSGSIIFSSASVGDIDGDGKKEVFVATINGKVFAFMENGNDIVDITLSVPDPILTLENGRFWATPIIDDFFGDGRKELFVVTRGIPNKAYLIYPDGTVCAGWPLSLDGPVIATPVSYDIDNDNLKEIILVTENKLLYILKPDGRFFPGSMDDGVFKRLDDSLDISGYSYSSPAVADIDNDGEVELIVAGGSNPLRSIGILYVFERDGRLRDGFPVYTEGWISSGIGIGNLDDEDSTLEIAFATSANKIYAIDHRGITLTGFPLWLFFYGERIGGPAVADIDGDNICEIAIGGLNQLLLLNHRGTPLPGWPIPTRGNASWSEPAIVDIDGDTTPEIIFASNDSMIVSAFEINGDEVPGFPLKVTNSIFATPTIATLNDSIGLSIIVTTYDDHIYIWDLGSRETNLDHSWTTARGNQSRTGMACQPQPSSLKEKINETNLSIEIFPNPFNNSVKIRYSAPQKSEFIRLFIFDITGRRVDELELKADKHTIVWKPEKIPSGLYFFVVKLDEKMIVKKAILLK